jgi:hypothetical protein
MRRIVAVAALLAVLTGCAQTDDTSTPSASTSSPAPSSSPDNYGMVLQADPSITQTHPITFTSWTPIAPDRIAVHFETGSPQCYGVDATTTETPTTVTVALHSGIKPSAQGHMCSMIAMFATLEIPLKAPLNDRHVISAS